MSNVLVDKNKIDLLANSISAKSGEPLTLTLDEMVEAVDGIESGGGGSVTQDAQGYIVLSPDGGGGGESEFEQVEYTFIYGGEPYTSTLTIPSYNDLNDIIDTGKIPYFEFTQAEADNINAQLEYECFRAGYKYAICQTAFDDGFYYARVEVMLSKVTDWREFGSINDTGEMSVGFL